MLCMSVTLISIEEIWHISLVTLFLCVHLILITLFAPSSQSHEVNCTRYLRSGAFLKTVPFRLAITDFEFRSIIGERSFAANLRGFARTPPAFTDCSPTIFFANYGKHLTNSWRKLTNAVGVRPSSREFARSSPRTSEHFVKRYLQLGLISSLGLMLGWGLEWRLWLGLLF
jgi:hypothetical protein